MWFLVQNVQKSHFLGHSSAQLIINCLGTGAKIKAPKALRSEMPKASKGCGMG